MPNIVEIIVRVKDNTAAGLSAAQSNVTSSVDKINAKMSSLGKIGGAGAGVIGGAGAALSMAAPFAAAGIAAGAFGAVAGPVLSKVSTAQTALTKAEAQYAAAVTKPQKAAALLAEQKATAGLSDAQKGLLGPLSQVEGAFSKLQDSATPALGSLLKLTSSLMPLFGTLVKAGGSMLQAIAAPLNTLIKSPFFTTFTKSIGQLAAQMGPILGKALVQIIQLFGQLLIQLGPIGLQLTKTLLPAIIQLAADMLPILVVGAKVVNIIVQWLDKNKLLVPALGIALGAIIALKLGLFALEGAAPWLLIIAGIALMATLIIRYHQQIWDFIKRMWNDVYNFVKGLWNSILGFAKQWWPLLLGPAGVIAKYHNDIWQFIQRIWNNVLNFIKGVWNHITADAKTAWDTIWNNTVGRVQRGVQDVQRWFNNFRTSLGNVLSNMRNDAANAWNTIWANTVSKVTNGVTSVVNFFKGLPGKMVSALGNAGNTLLSWGKGVIQGLLNGMTNIIGSVWNFIKGIPGKILGFLGIHSPPDWAIDAGKHIMNGIGIGMSQAQNAAKKATTAFTSSTVANIGGGGVARWLPTVLRALSMEHLPASLAGQVMRQISTESGGNPNAINNTDINAQRGDPSRGLLQTIGSTFAAYHWPGTSNNIYDPLANIAAAINYARHVYGPSLMSGGMGLGSGHGYGAGGIGGGWATVGEYGRELVRLPQGSHVYPHSQSGGIGGQAGGGVTAVQLEISSAGQSQVEQFMLFMMRNLVRTRGGGSVQAAFGTGGNR